MRDCPLFGSDVINDSLQEAKQGSDDGDEPTKRTRSDVINGSLQEAEQESDDGDKPTKRTRSDVIHGSLQEADGWGTRAKGSTRDEDETTVHLRTTWKTMETKRDAIG
jgi:Arc/MetJ-type ribon-helix-helix transcriptional regulator